MKKDLSFLANLFKPAQPVKRKPAIKRKTKPLSKIPKEKILLDLNAAIKTSGCKNLTVGGLFRSFGYKKRGPNNLSEINTFLSENKLYSYPPLTMELKWSSKIGIYKFPVKQQGDLFSNERELQKFMFDNEILSQLNLTNIIAEFSPDHTKDRLDFLAKDGNKNVVIEVKNKGGTKKAVEQVLRYAGMLRQQHPEQDVRKILITGIQDQHTAKAIHGMTIQERDSFEWYLYNYNDQTKSLFLEKVNYEQTFTFLPSNY